MVGASGGIGAALARGLGERGFTVTGLSRTPGANGMPALDVTDEGSIAAAADGLRSGAPFELVIVATGLLHDASFGPEKSLAELDPERLARAFAVNAIGPALVAKHFVPLLPRTGRAVFAALSARVGSISDNRLGGWYGYRASKAALNQIVRTLGIELARSRPEAICVGLHPGTVDTRLSAPYHRDVPSEQLFAPEQAAESLIGVIERLTSTQSGRCIAWDGGEIAP